MMRALWAAAVCVSGAVAGPPGGDGGPAREPEAAKAVAEPEVAEVVELVPGMRVNRAERWLEFDGRVAVDAHDPQTPDVYLEVIVTGPDSREHEALVVTGMKPSFIHAGLLALGLESGRPGQIGGTAARPEVRPPVGPGVTVEFRLRDGEGRTRTVDPTEWIVSRADGRRLEAVGGGAPGGGGKARWLFAGSRLVERRVGAGEPAGDAPGRAGPMRTVYDADGTGVIIGLHCFGSEVLAWPEAMSPDAATLSPEWIADRERIPAIGTGVVVRIRAEAAGGGGRDAK